MIRFLFRFIGYWFLAGALVAAVIDGSKSIAASSLVTTPLGQHFQQLAPSLLQRLEFGIQNNLGLPWLWDFVFINMLAWPSFAVLGIFSLIFLMIGRRKLTRAITEDAA
jgi:hypothetical protein